MRLVPWLALCTVPWLLAPSKVYRCEVDGVAVWTDRACAAGDLPADLPALGTVPALKGADLAKRYDERTKRERAAHDKARSAWLEAHARRKEAEAEAEATRQAERVARRKAARAGYTVRSPSSAEAPKK